MTPRSGEIPLEDPSSDLAWTRRLAFRLVRDEAASDDISQDVWLIARRARPDPARSLRPWLSRVVVNLIRRRHRDSSRRVRRELASEPPEASLSADQLLERAELQRLLLRLLGELPEPSRQIVLLHYFEGLTSETIGRRLQLPAGTVRWRLSRAIEELRRKLDRTYAAERERWVGAFLPLFAAEPAHAEPGNGWLAPRQAARWLATAGRAWLALVPLGGLLVAGAALWQAQKAHEPRDPDASVAAPRAAASARPATRAPAGVLRLDAAAAGARAPARAEMGTLEGRVVDPEGRGLPGAMVAVLSGDPTEGWPNIRTVGAGPDGRFVVSAVPSGKYVLAAQRNGFAFVYQRPPLSLAAGESRRGLQLTLTRGGHQVRGRVTDSGGGWVAGAQVSAHGFMGWTPAGRASGTPLAFAVTDARGEYQMTIASAPYLLRVEADGYMPGGASVESSDQLVQVRLEPGVMLAGRVVRRSTGDPVPGAEVFLETANGDRVPRRPQIFSDDAGRFVMGPVAAGPYHLQASAGALVGRTARPIAVTVPASGEVLLELQSGSSVTGQVVGPGGRPLAGVDITMAAGNPRSGPIAAHTGPDGRYLIEGLLPGDRFFTARAPDRDLLGLVKSVRVEGPLTTIDFALERGVAVEGRVVDCAGVGIGGAELEALPDALVQTWPVLTTSSPTGAFRLSGLPPGNVRLEIEHGRHGVPVFQTIATGRGRSNLELRLPCAR